MKLIKELPDPFIMNDGQRVATVEDWNRRRVEIKAMMLNSQYGTMPATPGSVTVTASAPETLDAGDGNRVEQSRKNEHTQQKGGPCDKKGAPRIVAR